MTFSCFLRLSISPSLVDTGFLTSPEWSRVPTCASRWSTISVQLWCWCLTQWSVSGMEALLWLLWTGTWSKSFTGGLCLFTRRNRPISVHRRLAVVMLRKMMTAIGTMYETPELGKTPAGSLHTTSLSSHSCKPGPMIIPIFFFQIERTTEVKYLGH